MLQKYLLVWLIGLCAIAYAWPTGDDVSLINPFEITAPGLKYLFAATMFAIGCMLPPQEVRDVVRRWPTVLGGTAIQYISMPLLAFGVGHAFGFEGDLLRGVILVGCVPGAMASNVLTKAAGGNVSYSVSLTTSATLLSPLVVPFVLYAAVQVDLPQAQREKLIYDAFVILSLQVVLPVMAGFAVSRASKHVERLMQEWGSTFANASILWIIAVIVFLKRDSLQDLDPMLGAALLALNVAGYLAGYGGGRALKLNESQRRALTLEIGMQNAGLGALMASQLFPNSITSLPPVLYMVGCMLTGTMLAQFWANREPHS
ncbi:MAG: bile acid:sodium symporter family protein [Planctomycetota bacterium]|nr:bile acid:sodium symporter family protein [Planctomycetota bacterium]